jgi:hypothetical protein
MFNRSSLALAVLLLLDSSPAAQGATTLCQTNGKSWRLIDGRKCWTDRWMPKDRLAWASEQRRIVLRRPPPERAKPKPSPAPAPVPMPPPRAEETPPERVTFQERYSVEPVIVPRRVRTVLVGGPQPKRPAPPPPVRASLAAGLSALVLLAVLAAGGVAAFKWRG